MSSGLWWRGAIVVLLGVLLYASSLPYPFVFDDKATIVDNTSIRDLWSSRVLVPDREVPTAGRPLVNVTHAVNYAIGGLDPAGYRAVNLAVHLLCALVVLALVRRTLAMPRLPDAIRLHAGAIATGSALLWTVHPLNSEVVEYITERSESLMALCLLTMLYAAQRAIGSRAKTWDTIAVAAGALGMACKESMVIAPLALWLYDRTFAFGSWTAALRARWRLYAALAATWLLLAALIWSGPRAYSAGFSTSVTPWSYLLNQATLIPRYLRLTLWPVGLVVAYGPPLPLALQDVWLGGLIVCVLIAVTLVALVRWPLAGFVGAWFFLTLAPTSSVLPIATEAGAERRMYLALIPLLTAIVAGVQMLIDRGSQTSGGSESSGGSKRTRPTTTTASESQRVVVGFVVAATVALSAATVLRAREYASSLGLAQTVLDRWPTSFGHAIVGTQLAIAGRHDEAIAELRTAAPGYNLARYHLGGELFNRGRLNEALPELQQFVANEPWRAEAVPARTMIGRALMAQRRWTEADVEMRRVLTMAPAHSEARTAALGALADSVFTQERFTEAIGLYQEFLGERPRDVGGTINLGVALAQTGRTREAVELFRRAIQLEPSNPTARRNLAIAMEGMPR